MTVAEHVLYNFGISLQLWVGLLLGWVLGDWLRPYFPFLVQKP